MIPPDSAIGLPGLSRVLPTVSFTMGMAIV